MTRGWPGRGSDGGDRSRLYDGRGTGRARDGCSGTVREGGEGGGTVVVEDDCVSGGVVERQETETVGGALGRSRLVESGRSRDLRSSNMHREGRW